MKFTDFKFLMILSTIFLLGLTSCEEGATIDIPGPDIDYQFSYSDLSANQNLRSGNAYQLVAKSDTIKGKDIESYLAASGKDYTSVVEAATITNALLTLSENTDFAGVDSLQIRYQMEGSSDEIVLAQASFNDSTDNTMKFSDLKISKAQAFDLIKKNIVAKIYAKFDPTKVSCFQPGASYRFTAKTMLSIKLSALTEGLMGNSN